MAGLRRKTVTVLFADVVNWTPLGEELDPESVRGFQTRLFDELRAVIERHGGTVEKYMGDAVMAVFGVPHVHEDDALRAVRAADEMRAALARVNEGQDRPLSLRTGLNTGEVVAGDGHALVTGDAVNVAARLEKAAGAGGILIGAKTYELVRDAVLAESVEPLELKGKSARITAWRVTAVVPGAPGRARRLDSPLVGRTHELALLRQALARVTGQRSCHLFTVLGAAGVGKSRLVNELLAAPDAPRALVGRCLPYGDGITYWPLRDVVRAIGSLEPLVSPGEAAAIQAVIGGAGAPTTQETFRAVRRLVEAVAHADPLVLVFEDVHWAEATFLDLVEHVAENVRDAAVLLVCLARPELLDGRAAWGGGKLNSTTILLEPLDADESDLLVAHLGGGAISGDLQQTITEVAEGNPLFLEEMVAMTVEDPSAATVPPSIHALLTARLERLPDAERDVLAAAAVAGRFFSREAVAQLVEDVDEPLAALERKELIRPQRVSFTGDDAYRFRHILIRDAAYDALAKATRASLHERLADWLAATAGTDVDELVGFHLEQAALYRAALEPGTGRELAQRAATHLGETGRIAFDRNDVVAATRLLRRAVALLGPTDALRSELLHPLSSALWAAGFRSEAQQALDEALAAAVADGNRRLEWYARLEDAARRSATREAPPAVLATVAREAVDTFAELGDELGLARAWRRISLVAQTRYRYGEAAEAGEQALEHARRAGDVNEEARIVDGVCTALVFGPAAADEAIARCEELLERARGNLLLEANVSSALGALWAMTGRFDVARTLHPRASQIYDELGLHLLRAGHSELSGTIEFLAGDPVAAEAEYRLGYDTFVAFGRAGLVSYQASRLARAVLAQGRVDEAETLATRAEADAADGDCAAQVAWRVARTYVDVERGRLHSHVARNAVALARETDAPNLQAEALLALSAALGGDAATQAEAQALFVVKGNVAGATLVPTFGLQR